MSRTQNTRRNLIFNVIKFVAQLVLQFLLRTILIYLMGNSYVGLNGLFSNIFQFLNLAELGIGSAIVFAMYKPIADNDIEKVKALQNLYKKFYLIIVVIILLVGSSITPFLKTFISDTSEIPADINIYILFIMYLINAVVGYLSAHKRSLLLAYERNDIENKIKTLCLIAMTVAQIVILYLFRNYYLYFAINILFVGLECLLIHIYANKYYPEINGKSSVSLDAETKKTITKNITALSMHKIGTAVVFSTDNILVSSLFGVVILGIYSNYAMIITAIATFIGVFSNAFTGSVGNLIASKPVDYTYAKYKQINFIFSFVVAFCTICLLVLFQPFIKVWTSRAEGGPFMLDFATVIIICISFYLMRMRTGTLLFRDCAGLFWQDRWKPLIEAVVNLGASIGLGYLIGINGIFLGTIISTLIAPFWVEPLILYKHYFKRSVKSYFARYALDLVIMCVCCAVTFFICSFIPDAGIWWFVLKSCTCIILSGGLLVLAYAPTKEFRDLFAIGKNMLMDFFKKKKK